MKKLSLLFVLLLAAGTVWAQASTVKQTAPVNQTATDKKVTNSVKQEPLTRTQKIYHYYLNKDMASWKQLIDEMEAQPSLTEEERLDLLNFEYGYVAWRLGDEYKDKDEANEYLQKAYEHLAHFREDSTYMALSKAYDAAFIGYQIGIHPIKAPFIGLKSKHFMKEAVALDSTHYFVHIQLGNIMYYMPEAFGGSKKEGVHQYMRAGEIMREQGVDQENWMYMNLILTVADAYKKEKDYDKVEEMYQKALELEPNYSYVKNQLIPGLENLRAKQAAKK